MPLESEEKAGQPADWPAMSMKQAASLLCAPGALFEMETIDIRGVPTRCWKNQPPTLPDLAKHALQNFQDRTFLVFQEERVTFQGWYRACSMLAHELAGLGIGKGDRVALAMRNLPEWPVVFFAVTALDAIVAPLNGWWTGPEMEYGLSHSGAKALICDAEAWERIARLAGELPLLEHVFVTRATHALSDPARSLESVIGLPRNFAALPDREFPGREIQPDDDATIFYTSGTTGSPKGALGTHRSSLVCTLASSFSAQRGMLRRGETSELSSKTTLVAIPMFHVTACYAVMMPTIFLGGMLVFMHKWETAKGLELIEKERVNVAGGVPTIAWQILNSPERDRYDLGSLEMLSYGGAPSSPDLVQRISEEIGVPTSNGWGMTETSATVTVHSAEDYLAKPESCGPPLPVSDLKITNEDGTRELPAGQVGELWASGPQVVKGYWNDPEATRNAFRNCWVRTGDLARLDKEGFCYIVDRAKDVIIRGGENIYSSEVEDVLYDHPSVIDAALVGLPHPTLGQVPAAVVHLAKGSSANETELRDWVGTRLAAFKVPERVLLLDTLLPRNANGKIIKKQLPDLFAGT